MKKLLCLFLVVALVMGVINIDVSAVTTTSSGSCGSKVTYTLDSTGTLTISGTGAMYDYSYNESPFQGNSSIKKIIINQGVTSVGKYAF